MTSEWLNLERLLHERIDVIADHAFRDRDPAAHLERLQSISAALDDEFQKRRATLPARLNHFMTQCSYQKALAYIDELKRGAAGPPAL